MLLLDRYVNRTSNFELVDNAVKTNYTSISTLKYFSRMDSFYANKTFVITTSSVRRLPECIGKSHTRILTEISVRITVETLYYAM